MKRLVIIILSIFALLPAAYAKEAPSKENQKEARELFNKVYNLVFGNEGSSLSYSVNIIGIYKTEGDIKYKGKKLQYREKRYEAYEDGVTAYMVDKKKKTVDIFNANDDAKDKYLSKFKYDINNFDFFLRTEGNYYIITAKVKNTSLFGIRSVEARVIKSNLHPVSLKISLSIFNTTVKISKFKAGNISDHEFVFPKSRFADYEFTDNRKGKR